VVFAAERRVAVAAARVLAAELFFALDACPALARRFVACAERPATP
jgi:hypothetical protein